MVGGIGRHADAIAGMAIVLFGAWFFWEAMQLREGPGYAAVGPRVFPLIVGIGLLLSGASVLVGGLRNRRSGGDAVYVDVPPVDSVPATVAAPIDASRNLPIGASRVATSEHASDVLAATAGIAPDDLNASSDMAERLPTDWRTLGLMAVALAGLIVLWRPLGFILAAALFVVAGAWVLGSRAPVRDLIVGVLVSVGTFALFTRVLGLELPAGLLAEAIRALTGIVTWLYSRP